LELRQLIIEREVKMRCENKHCQLPYQYNKGRLIRVLLRPWTWGFSYIPGQMLKQLRWLCEGCANAFDVQQLDNRIVLVAKPEPASLSPDQPVSGQLSLSGHSGLPLAYAPAEN
jgi:hypothetical protein